MSEPIKWGQLESAERNRLLHEQVMGKPIFCSEELDEFPCDPCPVCHATFCIIERLKYDPKTPHPRGDIPAYSESLDAAWLVVREMNKPIDGPHTRYDRYAAFIDALEQRVIGSTMFFDLFYCDPESDDQHLTGDRICLAALIACGVEVELS